MTTESKQSTCPKCESTKVSLSFEKPSDPSEISRTGSSLNYASSSVKKICADCGNEWGREETGPVHFHVKPKDELVVENPVQTKSIQIPRKFENWYEEKLILTRLPKKRLSLMTGEAHEKVKQSLFELTEKMDARDATGMRNVFNLTKLEVEIGEDGELLIPEDLYTHLGRLGKIKCTVEHDGQMIIQRKLFLT